MNSVLSWITLNPNWYVSERNAIARKYPEFRVDEKQLSQGKLCFYGELVVRPPGGSVRHPVLMFYSDATPFEPPIIIPLEALPEFDEEGGTKAKAPQKMFDRRHQMPGGSLCLFQRETRGSEGGEGISGVDALRRAEKWFLGYHTGRWPPDSHDSELEPHFNYTGNVLLSSAFYADDMVGHGRFFMVRDMRRVLDGTQKEKPPLIVTLMTQQNGGIESIFDARLELQHIYPWLSNETWSPENFVELEKKKRTDDFFGITVEHGHWWTLAEEPHPFHNGQGLLKILDQIAPDGDGWNMISQAFLGELTLENHFFGFRYPGRDGRPEWLVLFMPASSTKVSGGVVLLDDDKKRSKFESSPVACYRCYSARSHDIHLRNTGVVSTIIQKKSVAIIGLGALGAHVAEMLAQAGVEYFRLCDNDLLSPGNVARHIGGLKDFGLRKTDVVSRRLFDINPSLVIEEVLNDPVNLSLDQMVEFIRPCDLIISTTADENVESIINQVAVLEKKPVIYGRALRRGTMGRVFLVRPGIDACKQCLGHLANESRLQDTAPQGWPEVTESDDDVLLHECGRPVIPASAVDLSFVASLTARMALDFLEDREQDTNHWLWTSQPATDVDPRFERPMTCLRWRFVPLTDCVTCSEPDLTGVKILDEAKASIINEVESPPNTETGGILIGYVDDSKKAVIVRATAPGPRATKTATWFDRDVDFVQSQLQQSAIEFGTQGLYLGEWHSHLETDPEPSPTDIRSLTEIACSSNYATRCPVLLIAGLDTESGKYSVLKGWCFQAFGRMHKLEIV